MELCCIGVLFVGIICFALMGVGASLSASTPNRNEKSVKDVPLVREKGD